MKKYKHLVFDIDGTLLDTLDIHFVSLKRALKELRGVEMSTEELSFSFGIPGTQTMKTLGVEDTQKAMEVWLKYYEAYTEEVGLHLFPGMQEVLDELRKTGVTMGIITSKMRNEYDWNFKQLGLLPYFAFSVTASDTDKGKPDPAPMLEYLRVTGAKPEEVLYFGDTIYDIQCAQAAGTDQALVLWSGVKREGIEATYRLEKPEEILKFA